MNKKLRKEILDEECGYTSVSNRALYWKTLSDASYRLYSLIISLVNSKGYCWGSIGYFSEKLGWSHRKTSRTIKDLSDKKLIRREKRTGQTSLTYLLAPTHLPIADKKSQKGKQKTVLPKMADPTVTNGSLGMSSEAYQHGQICQQGTVTDDTQISFNERYLMATKTEKEKILNDKSFNTASPNGSGEKKSFVSENRTSPDIEKLRQLLHRDDKEPCEPVDEEG